MTKSDLVDAVLESRDEISPDLDDALIESIVEAEVGNLDDASEALQAIRSAIDDAIERGVSVPQ